MKRKIYVRPQIASIGVEMESPVMAGSVIVENNIIKATEQEVTDIDFSDNSQFDISWE